jgi:DKNYY family protein
VRPRQIHVFIDGLPLPDADVATFELLDRPGFAKDRDHVFQRDRAISDDPAHFELLDGELAMDSRVVYWSDGSVLSEDPTHFAIVSTADHYLYTKDGRTVHVNGNPIPGADPSTFQVLQGAYARDGQHVFYFDQPIVEADLSSFRPLDAPYASDSARVYWMGKAIDGADPSTFRVLNANFECSTNCSETSISFAE